jgi:hypothetical protein
MNSTVAPGPSYRPLYRFLGVPSDADHLSLRECFAAFCVGGDGYYKTYWDFATDVRSGHVVPFIVEHGDNETHFGIELMHHPETGGPVFSVLYYTGELSGQLLSELAFYLYTSMQDHKRIMGTNAPGYLRVVGRRGWSRLIKRMGMEMDEDGYICEDQPTIRLGLIKHLN